MHQTKLRSQGIMSFSFYRAKLIPLLVLAAPIVLSQMAQIATGVVDVIMAGHLGPSALGAISTGAALWTPAMIFLLGLLYALTHETGALKGRGREKEIPPLAAKGVIMGLLGGVVLGVALFFGAKPLFSMAGVAPDLVSSAASYTRIIALSFPGLGLFVALRYLLEASGGARLVTLSVLGSIAIKIILNRVLVFGGFGLAPMGTDGFGLATVIVFWTMAATLAAIVLLTPGFRFLWCSRVRLSDIALPKLFAFFCRGISIALNFLSDYLVMSVVAIFIAAISPVAISGHQVAFNIVSVLLMVTTGVGMAGAIMVSKAVGAGAPAQVRHAAGIAFVVSMVLALAISAGLFVYGDVLVSIYTNNQGILRLGSELVRIATLLFPIDVAVITLGFIMRGMGKPGTPFLVMLVSHWGISIPLGYVLAETALIVPSLGVAGWWYGLLGGLLAAACLMAVCLMTALAGIRPGPVSSKAWQRPLQRPKDTPD